MAVAFRTSLTEYGLIDGNGNVLPVRDDQPSEASRDDRDPDEADDEADEPDLPKGPGRQRLEVALRDGRKAVLVLPDDLTVADTKKVTALLTALAADYEG